MLIDRETQTAEYGVGGGIVWDSESGDEYAEALLKARVLTESPPQFSLLETLLWTPEDEFFLHDKHIARLLDSAEYFDFPVTSQLRWSSSPARAERSDSEVEAPRDVSRPPLPNEIIESYLNEISSQFISPQRVRLLLNKNGDLSHEAKPFQPAKEDSVLKASLAKQPVNSNNVFLFHKTTYRDMYDSARKDFLDCDDVLLFNEHGELTEFTIGNLVVEMDGKIYTPPISCGLLAGTFRAHLLEMGQVGERVIRVDEIENCKKIFLVNSVRKWQRVEITK